VKVFKSQQKRKKRKVERAPTLWRIETENNRFFQSLAPIFSNKKMSGDLQAKRKGKNRNKRKLQLHELEKKEHLEESQLGLQNDGDDRRPKAKVSRICTQ
jgi:hypothetical protein